MTAVETRPKAPSLKSYSYEVVDQSGSIDSGQLMSFSENEAADRLRRLGLRPLSVKPDRSAVFSQEFSIPGLGPRVKPAELAVLARQFSTMINAGISLTRSLTVLGEQAQNPMLERTVRELLVSVESGDSLSQAIERHPRIFDEFFVSMIRAGEAAGALDVVLLQLATTLERTVAIRQKIRSAMSYPIAVLVMVLGVITVMLTFVVPVFDGIYADLGGTLPLPTRILVAVSNILTERLPVVALAVVAAIVGFRRWKRSPRGRQQWDRLKLHMPLIGSLLHKIALARMGRTLGVLTRSGVPVLETLRIAAATTGNAVVSKGLIDTMGGVQRGEQMAANLARHRVFPPMVVQLVTVGEETGSLDDMLDTIGRTYEDDVETAVAGFAALIEPLLMAFIGLVVGGMVVSLYLPMFRIIDLVQ